MTRIGALIANAAFAARRARAAATLIATVALAASTAQPAAAFTEPALPPPPGGTCSAVSFHVTVPPLQLPATIAGTLCRPDTANANTGTLQVLLHGGTYNQSYWDFSYEPQTYSYVWAAVADGFTTLSIDRLGYGLSTHPLSALVTVPASAATVHQVISDIRPEFTEIVIVGHSIGSAVTIAEAGIYHDVNAVVVTGLLHHPGSAVARVIASIWPAALDPAFRGDPLDPGYVTTRPGQRASDFYFTPNADPNVIATDERTKDDAPGIEAGDYLLEATRTPGNWYAQDITAPTLVVVGQHDGINCGAGLNCADGAAVNAIERRAYKRAASLQTDVIPNAGHDLNLQRNAQSTFGLIDAWIESHT